MREIRSRETSTLIEADVIIVGGGAAGFFTAINAAEINPGYKIIILERGREVLNKVKISGGGRCNVTHAEFLPYELSQNYPRGEKELLGPFHKFSPGDTIAWFEARGVRLKTEEDGRMFPVSDSSQTIIDCFLDEAKKRSIDIQLNQSVREITRAQIGFSIQTSTDTFMAKKVVVCSGSNPKIWKVLEKIGHSIIAPVPSLFTFNIKDERIADLAGISTKAHLTVRGQEGKELLVSEGPLLITHWGMSGPAVLKLSAWGARILAPLKYEFELKVNWLQDLSEYEVLGQLQGLRLQNGRQTIYKYSQFGLPKRLWRNLLKAAGISETLTWAEATGQNLQQITNQIAKGIFHVQGKSTFKEEFVTAGGVDLKEVNFKTFESRICKNLYLVGEVLNIDAITGGFNFQNAWTGGFIAAQDL